MFRSSPRSAFPLIVIASLTAAGAFASRTPTAQSYSFDSVQIVGGGFITGIVAHPLEQGLFYVRTDIGGAYRWNANNQQWSPLTDGVSPVNSNWGGTASIAIDPTDANNLYLAQGTYVASWSSNAAIFKSVDQGKDFTVISLPFQLGSNDDGRYSGERLAVTPWSPNVLYLGTNANGLWKSTDSAETWSQVTKFPVTSSTADGVGVIFVMFGPPVNNSTNSTIYVGVSDSTTGLYRSTDNGNTWQAIPGQPTGNLPTNAALSPNGKLYVTYSQYPGPNSGNNGQVWAHDTKQSTWANVTPPSPPGIGYGFGFAKVAVDPKNPNTIMVGTVDRYYPGEEIYRSKNGGATWINLGAEPNAPSHSVFDTSLSPWLLFGGSTPTNNLGNWIGAMAIDPFNSSHFFYGTGQTLWTTDDLTNVDAGSTVHWSVGAQGIEETAVQALASPPSGAHLLSAVGDIGAFRHDNLNVSPARGQFYTPQLWTNTSIDFAQSHPSVIARVGSPAYGATLCGGHSTDQGDTWTAFTNAPNCANGPGTIAISADGASFVWAPSAGGTYFSTNNGNSWTLSTGLGSTQTVTVVSDRVNRLKFYAFDQNAGTLYVSTNGGAAFTSKVTGLGTGSLGSISAAPGVEGDLWLALKWNGLYHSTNSGASVTKVSSAVEGFSLGFGMPATGNTYPALYLLGTLTWGSNEAIYRSDNGGASWIRINDDAHQYANPTVVIGDPRIYGRVYIGNNGRGIIYGDIAAH